MKSSNSTPPVLMDAVHGSVIGDVKDGELCVMYQGKRRLVACAHISSAERRRRTNGTVVAICLAGILLSLSAQFGWRVLYPLGYGLVGAGIALWISSRFDVFVETTDNKIFSVAKDLSRADADEMVRIIADKIEAKAETSANE